LLAIIARMRNAWWIVIGLATGAGCGSPFGAAYAAAGAFIGAAGGLGIFLAMRRAGR
jgi:hypothetical protein